MLVNKHLVCSNSMSGSAVQSVLVQVETTPAGGLELCYELCADLRQLNLPALLSPSEVDGLWKHTCFEMFVAVQGDARYHEFNFSPSRQWAAYAFSSYRERITWQAKQAPPMNVAVAENRYLLLKTGVVAADLPPNRDARPLQLGLAAVLEANDGSCSYWALLHPVEYPDFHHQAGFDCILSFS